MRSFVLASVLVVAAFAAATGTASATPSSLAVHTPSALAAPAPGGLGVRLVDAPTATRDDPRARLYIVDHLQPGSVINRRIEVANTTAAPMHVAVYAAAASIAGGTFTGADGHAANDLSSWTTLSQPVVDLAAGAVAPVTVTVTVPSNAAPGEQYAAVWAEISSPTGSGVMLVNRVGVRIYLSVGGANAPPSSFTVDSLTTQRASDGHPVVIAQVNNTGGRALDMSGSLSLSDGPGSLSAGPFVAQLGNTLAPGQSGTVTIPLDRQLPNGPWKANLTLKSGLVEQSAQASIEFPSGPGTADPVATQKSIGDYLVILIGALALLVILVITAVTVLVRRRSAALPTMAGDRS
ncbi:MAG: hypothetical protein JWR88_2574 [Pseudonocardia sp.]|jgi:hypothetical protein|nr:hypothetical protein [Pseudonocardia sp.]